MTEDPIAILETRCCRPPTVHEPVFQEFVGGWAMIPHGDRRDESESGRIETQIRIAEREHNVVRVFVLSNDVRDVNGRRLREAPSHQISEGMTRAECSINFLNDRWFDRLDRVRRDRPHGESYDLRAELVSG